MLDLIIKFVFAVIIMLVIVNGGIYLYDSVVEPGTVPVIVELLIGAIWGWFVGTIVGKMLFSD